MARCLQCFLQRVSIIITIPKTSSGGRMKTTNEKGFTLIELMIVIAIIGVLAAIAIPNFISYRNKSYCASMEGDAKSVAAALASYFSVPTRTALPADLAALKTYEAVTVGADNDVAIDSIGAGMNSGIQIDVSNAGTRCPRGTMFTTYMGTSAPGFWTK